MSHVLEQDSPLSNQTPSPLCFLDAKGGEIARLATAVAHAHGLSDAIALVWGDEQPVSDDVKTVLDEVGMMPAHVAAFDPALTSKHRCVWLGPAPEGAAIPNAEVWPAVLLGPDEPHFDRLVKGRLLRDGIAKRIRALAKP